jgi:hypothetical protein
VTSLETRDASLQNAPHDHVRDNARSHDAKDDGAACEACRVLHKNSNDSSAELVCGGGFIARTGFVAAHFSLRLYYAHFLIMK